MKKVLVTLATTFLVFLFISARAQPNKLTVAKEPEWVTIHNIDFNNANQESEAEDGYLDVAFEKQVSLIDKAKYYRKAFKVLSESGVENNSEISVDFDPLYQNVLLHKVRIIRDGVFINKLDLSKFKTIQQESDLRAHLYNGTLTALLMLEDVRKGDIIEYSYTIKGFNPIFNNKYCDVFETRFTVPIGCVYYKVVTPADKKINIRCTDSRIHERTEYTKMRVQYEWKLTGIEPLRVDKKTPSWFDPFPTIFISEYNSWGEVSNWASKLFPGNVHLSSALQKKIAEIRADNATNEARTLAALHFVQDEIRYLGIEMGTSSHKPGDPNKIFSQRFGDCKDKSYLLTTMLRDLGIEASPVLINTSYKKAINNWLPSHSAFDHVTVRANVDGKIYFFDPTISMQRGTLRDIVYPDYQTGLVVANATQSLTNIPFYNKSAIKVKEIFDVPDMTGKAQLKVITRYSGSFADDNRNDFNNNSLYEIKKKYREFYSTYFEKIIADSLSYQSDNNIGEFITTEYYTISNLWKTENGQSITTSAFAPFIINSVLSKPDNEKRVMPYALRYPANYTEDIEVNLPYEWSQDMKQKMVQCGFFNLNAESYFSKRKVKLHYEYENLKDNVPAD